VLSTSLSNSSAIWKMSIFKWASSNETPKIYA
jgi:hypothetical protein